MARTEIPIVVIDPATGNAVSGASVTVVNRATSSNATIYAGETGGTTAANPRTTDANGRLTGWVERGPYRLDITGSSLTSYSKNWDSAPAADGSVDSAWPAALPYALVSRTAVQSVASGGFGSQLQINVATTDNGVATTGTAMADTTNYRLYARRTGLYLVKGALSFATGANFKWGAIYKNGSAVADLVSGMPSEAIVGQQVSLSGIVEMTAGDYIALNAYHVKGSADNVTGALSAAWLGRSA